MCLPFFSCKAAPLDRTAPPPPPRQFCVANEFNARPEFTPNQPPPLLRPQAWISFIFSFKTHATVLRCTHARTQRERQIDRLRVCNSFRELVRIAKEWVTAYSEMPVAVRRLFKHTHLHTACRLLGISSLSLEFLPEKDASVVDEEGGPAEGGEGGPQKGWAGGAASGSSKSKVEDREAARKSHAAQAQAELDGGGGPGVGAGGLGAGVAANGASSPTTAGGTAAMEINGRKARGGEGPQQAVAIGNGVGVGKVSARHKGAGGAGGKGAAGPEEPVKLVPFAVMRGPAVEQERWEVCTSDVRVCACLGFFLRLPPCFGILAFGVLLCPLELLS